MIKKNIYIYIYIYIYIHIMTVLIIIMMKDGKEVADRCLFSEHLLYQCTCLLPLLTLLKSMLQSRPLLALFLKVEAEVHFLGVKCECGKVAWAPPLVHSYPSCISLVPQPSSLLQTKIRADGMKQLFQVFLDGALMYCHKVSEEWEEDEEVAPLQVRNVWRQWTRRCA